VVSSVTVSNAPTTIVYASDPYPYYYRRGYGGYPYGYDGYGYGGYGYGYGYGRSNVAMGMVAGAAIGSMMWGPMYY